MHEFIQDKTISLCPPESPAGMVAPEMFVRFLGYHVKCCALIIAPVLLPEIGQLPSFFLLGEVIGIITLTLYQNNWEQFLILALGPQQYI